MKLFNVNLKKLVIGILSCSILCAAHAKDDGPDPSVTMEKEIQSYVINADGGFVLTMDLIILINEERAIKKLAQRPLSYNRTLETLEVTEAYTKKPDGRKVIVRPDQIKDQQESQSANAPMFQDSRVKVVIFPDVAVGDRLVLQYRKIRSTPLFPGHFEDLGVPAFHPIKIFSVIYDVPSNVQLFSDVKGFTASTPFSVAGRKIYQWDYVPSERARLENGSVSYFDYGDHLAVSTFADFGAFAKAYDKRAKEKAIATPKITELAKTIAANLNDPRAKAFALNNWVRKNIRYVAVYIGDGGVVPHVADAVLDNRYGDCKDHVALLEALLAAVGIDSTPALINFGNAYGLQKVPTLGVLNHVITYIPSLNLYLDSTADSIAAGYLPQRDLDKPVLLTKSGQMAQTPATQNSRVVNTTEFKIASSGAADFTHSSTASGWVAEFNRYSIRNMKQTDRDFLVQRLLGNFGQKGSGTVDVGKLDDTGDEYQLKFTGRTDNLVNLPGPIGVLTLSSFAGGIAQTVFTAASEKNRHQAFVCVGGEFDEQSRFDFPKELSIEAMPKSFSLHDANFDFTSNYVREDNAVLIKRHYKFHHQRAVCSTDDFKVMQPAIDAMIRDLRSQIIVQTRL